MGSSCSNSSNVPSSSERRDCAVSLGGDGDAASGGSPTVSFDNANITCSNEPNTRNSNGDITAKNMMLCRPRLSLPSNALSKLETTTTQEASITAQSSRRSTPVSRREIQIGQLQTAVDMGTSSESIRGVSGSYLMNFTSVASRNGGTAAPTTALAGAQLPPFRVASMAKMRIPHLDSQIHRSRGACNESSPTVSPPVSMRRGSGSSAMGNNNPLLAPIGGRGSLDSGRQAPGGRGSLDSGRQAPVPGDSRELSRESSASFVFNYDNVSTTSHVSFQSHAVVFEEGESDYDEVMPEHFFSAGGFGASNISVTSTCSIPLVSDEASHRSQLAKKSSSTSASRSKRGSLALFNNKHSSPIAERNARSTPLLPPR